MVVIKQTNEFCPQKKYLECIIKFLKIRNFQVRFEAEWIQREVGLNSSVP
jgi:HEAT repeat protein